ncbi:MAG: type II toxin-antitoxin system RelE/ParE family toxin [Deltaproteobacteria bacterium]|nr:type II toxin-antitoxin system RelE/ParE family toxin [Deltaproteobacteria bacterium]
MKIYPVFMTDEAEQDLLEIFSSIARLDSIEKANQVLEHLESLCEKLSSFPLRGHTLPELEKISVRQYRELHFKPYRIIYHHSSKEVFIHCILDGRRDLLDILQNRLLR